MQFPVPQRHPALDVPVPIPDPTTPEMLPETAAPAVIPPPTPPHFSAVDTIITRTPIPSPLLPRLPQRQPLPRVFRTRVCLTLSDLTQPVCCTVWRRHWPLLAVLSPILSLT